METNGVNSIPVDERRGRPKDLFAPWFAANISVLSVSFGAFILGFGLSFWQAIVVLVVGVGASNVLVGVIALAGKRASSPTMTISRSVFGVRGNRFPAGLSWVLNAGWETVLAVVATLATATIFQRLGWGGGTTTKVIALLVIVGLIMIGGLYGFTFIMRIQKWITLAAGILTLAYMGFSLSHVNSHALVGLPNGSAQSVIGAILFTMTGYGLGWVQAGADYSRYLPRSASSQGVVWWTTLGSSLPPVFLLLFGTLLAGSSKSLDTAIGADPVGALTQILPTWFLVPFAIVTVIGLVAGGIMDNYSSGLSLLNAGLRRIQAVSIDGIIMLGGSIGVVFFTGRPRGQPDLPRLPLHRGSRPGGPAGGGGRGVRHLSCVQRGARRGGAHERSSRPTARGGRRSGHAQRRRPAVVRGEHHRPVRDSAVRMGPRRRGCCPFCPGRDRGCRHEHNDPQDPRDRRP
jgi:NCS1 family nucleobase:cation symporter-1